MSKLKNLKQEKFCQEYMSGNNQTQAYLKTYPKSSKISAISNSSRMITYDNIRQRCIEIMQETTGLKITDFLTTLKECTKAEYPVIIDKTIKMFSDNAVKLQAVQTGFKILGLMSQQPIISGENIQFNVSNVDINALKEITNRLEAIELRQDGISGDIVNP